MFAGADARTLQIPFKRPSAAPRGLLGKWWRATEARSPHRQRRNYVVHTFESLTWSGAIAWRTAGCVHEARRMARRGARTIERVNAARSTSCTRT